MKLRCRRFEIPKRGHSRKEYEDAAAGDCVRGRFAVADGASESIFAGEWAALLCEAFLTDPPTLNGMTEWRDTLQQRWLKDINSRGQPWYVEEKVRDGAFATFIGVSFDEPDGDAKRPWHACAVGDSCLFHIRNDSLKLAFPLTDADGFGTRPTLIGSRQRDATTPLSAKGRLKVGDTLLVMTDALAQWFLASHAAGKKPWNRLIGMKESDFPAWVEAGRKSHRLKNDDVTLLVIELDDPKTHLSLDADGASRDGSIAKSEGTPK